MKKIWLISLLFLYIFIVFLASSPKFKGDEGRYIKFASNLTHGFYTQHNPYEITLWNGPGYPFLLMPFVMLKLPWIAARFLNAFLLFGAVVYFYRTMCLYLKKSSALSFSLLFGLYPPFMVSLPLLLTETFTIFLISVFSYYFCILHQQDLKSKRSFLMCGIFLAWLALTKIIFGYVILLLILFSLIFYLQGKHIYAKSFLVFSLAFLFCIPYLMYTYSLTGKFFYWGSSAGISLYWMSTPYKNEFGDWRGHDKKNLLMIPELKNNHLSFFEKIEQLPNIKKDEALKRQAIKNILHHPKKYFLNWLANIGRMLFSYPYSYAYDRLSTYFWLLPNMYLVVLASLCIYPTYICRSLVPFEIHMLLLFGLIAFGLSSLLSAYARQFYVLVPIFSLWIVFTIKKILKIEIRQF